MALPSRVIEVAVESLVDQGVMAFSFSFTFNNYYSKDDQDDKDDKDRDDQKKPGNGANDRGVQPPAPKKRRSSKDGNKDGNDDGNKDGNTDNKGGKQDDEGKGGRAGQQGRQ